MKNSLCRCLVIGSFLLTLSACGDTVEIQDNPDNAANEHAKQLNMDTNTHQEVVLEADADNEALEQRESPDQVYYFDFDRSFIKPIFRQMISEQASYLLDHPHSRIRIEGHTDDVGSREYNIGLGWRRAKAVARLMSKLGVSSKQMVLVSYGKEKPAVDGIDREARAKNRRAEIIYETR